MDLKWRDYVSGFVSAQQLCEAALLNFHHCCAWCGSPALQSANIKFCEALHKVHDKDSLWSHL